MKTGLLALLGCLFAASIPLLMSWNDKEHVEGLETEEAAFFEPELPPVEPSLEPQLKIGDAAPKLDIRDWLSDGKGRFEHVGAFRPGRIYVIEFLASWTPSSDQALNRCRQLQKQYDGQVQVIGLSPEPRKNFDRFLDKPVIGRESETYREVVDSFCLACDSDRSSYRDYLVAVRETSSVDLTLSFVIGKTGKLEWFGNPLEVDSAVKSLIDGQPPSTNAPGALEMGDQQRVTRIVRKMRRLQKDRGFEAALKYLDAKLEKEPSEAVRKTLSIRRDGIVMKMPGQGPVRVLREFTQRNKENAELLNEEAWKIAKRGETETVPVDLIDAAIEAAELAEKLEPGNFHVQDTLATLYDMRGIPEFAINAARNAVELSGENPTYIDRLQSLMKSVD